MIVSGTDIAADIYRELLPLTEGEHLTLGVVMAAQDPVIASFVRIKERAAQKLNVRIEIREIPEGSTTGKVVEMVRVLTEGCDGIIVQLPLPASIDIEAVLAAIPPEKDVDGISPDPIVMPPVAAAIREILERQSVAVSGAKAVVVGAGRLVGKPAAQVLHDMGAHVSVITKEEGSLTLLRDADIIVSGAGQPGLIKPHHLKKGVVLIDAGTSESGGEVVGDVDPACADIAALFTPVPGGVGPIAVAMIFNNLCFLKDHA